MKSFSGLAFERVVVINLRREPERLASFYDRLPDDWPFEAPVPFEALDGTNLTIPNWWQVGLSAWGCFQSHLRVIESALNDRVDSILILEDDAEFCLDFSESLRPFADHVPGDWEWIYLGGQHLHYHEAFPVRVCPHVYRPHNVHRTHAYGLRGRRVMEMIYRHLLERDHWGEHHHVDHRLGELHSPFEGGLYVPEHWLIGQAAGFSNIRMKEVEATQFVSAADLLEPQRLHPVVPVVGSDSRTRNTVAAILHHLGVSMGNAKLGSRPWEHESAIAAPALDQLFDHLYSQPWWIEKTNGHHRIGSLRFWAAKRGRSAKQNISMIGATHPLLAILAKEIDEAWNPELIVIADPLMPNQDSDDGSIRRQQLMMANGLKQFADRSADRIIHCDLRQETNVTKTIEMLIARLKLRPTAEQIENATRMLNDFHDAISKPT
ncbi:glycosyltransferase family 25 protein [Roseiconus lacunae]|uniref:Glycosyltransferase family 25 protein n=1 Tax=Roseiconus lacunae TaxID=2605694 RepID=A0ABT7PC31_9BACT|nr:glycosyltransferase family 25 protein [Roseiconus lacunae]MDM4014040.1 glycosyltransferase family 25 protein [Roseiconus lacunae]